MAKDKRPINSESAKINRSAIKGRGSTSNLQGRFAETSVDDLFFSEQVGDFTNELFERGEGDAFFAPSQLRDRLNPPKTRLREEKSRTIITKNVSPDVPFEQSINPYQGCEHGCVYCFARPTHSYWDLSPGLDFETQIFFKKNARALLLNALGKKSYRCKPIALGANTDPYQPAEKQLGITRDILEVLADCQHPFTIVTKSGLIQRDIDILVDMAKDNLVSVAISLTTLSAELKTQMEPRATSHQKRLETIKFLADQGIPVTVLAAPMIPFINDQELEPILEASWEAGARQAAYVLLRLPHEIKELFVDWLQAHYPDRKERVLNTIRVSRGGKLYQAEFGARMRGEGVFADLLSKRFEVAARRLGFSERDNKALNTQLFRAPNPSGQESLF